MFVGEYQAETRREVWALFDALEEWHGLLAVAYDLSPTEVMVLTIRAQSECEAYAQKREEH